MAGHPKIETIMSSKLENVCKKDPLITKWICIIHFTKNEVAIWAIEKINRFFFKVNLRDRKNFKEINEYKGIRE